MKCIKLIENLTKERITEILSAVDLTHLAEREGALTDNEIVWEDELSLGEKQRLAIARLIHHKPRFAILVRHLQLLLVYLLDLCRLIDENAG